MSARIGLAVLGAALLLPQAAMAQAPLPMSATAQRGLIECLTARGDLNRLGCYDRAMKVWYGEWKANMPPDERAALEQEEARMRRGQR